MRALMLALSLINTSLGEEKEEIVPAGQASDSQPRTQDPLLEGEDVS